MDSLDEITLTRTHLIRDAIQRLGTVGVALVVDGQRLEATLTDGDVRRALLAGANLDSPITTVIGDRTVHPRAEPVTCPQTASRLELLQTMNQEGIRHVVIVDEEQRPIRVVTLDELAGTTPQISAVVFAGGEGRRLRPLTEQTPKPMLPIAGRPLLEHIIERLVRAGITEISVAVRYLAPVITEYFGDGSRFGAAISYTYEKEGPLGTGGALSLIPRPSVPTLAINGDILTDVSYEALARFHNEQAAAVTLAVRRVDMQPPYGVVDTVGVEVSGIRERPLMHHFMNAGMYLLSPEVWNLIRPNSAFDMPDLVQRAIDSRSRVVAFPVGEDWLDIGDHAAYSSVVGGIARSHGIPQEPN